MVKKKTHTKVGTALARLSAQATKPASRQVARAGELLAIIARRMQRIEEDFFDIGVALKELKDKKLFVALGHPTWTPSFGGHGDLPWTDYSPIPPGPARVAQVVAQRSGGEA